MVFKPNKNKPELKREPLMSPEEVAMVSDVYQLDVMNLVEPKISEMIAKIPDFVIAMPDKELFKKCNPTPLDYALRTAFWREYDRIYLSNSGQKIKASDFCRGICTPGYFYSIIKKPSTLLWIIKPKQEYRREMESILSRGIERLWEIIEIPIYDKDDKVDYRLAGIVLQAIKQVEDRVQGMAIQRTQSVSVNINENSQKIGSGSMDDLNKKIAELERAVHTNTVPGQRDFDGNALPPASKKFETVELRPIEEWKDPDDEHPPQEQITGV